jgi:hypothetical protein
MIIQVKYGQPEIKIHLVEPGQGGSKLSDTRGVRLVITAPEIKHRSSETRIIRTGTWAYPPNDGKPYPPDPDELPTLIYPCFAVDDEGALVFRFDHNLYNRPCGRYLARLWIGPFEAALIDLDVMPHRFIVDEIEQSEREVCP